MRSFNSSSSSPASSQASAEISSIPQPAPTADSSQQAGVSLPPPSPPSRPPNARHWHWFAAGALLAGFFHTALQWISQLPWVRDMFGRFIWMRNRFPWAPEPGEHPPLSWKLARFVSVLGTDHLVVQQLREDTNPAFPPLEIVAEVVGLCCWSQGLGKRWLPQP